MITKFKIYESGDEKSMQEFIDSQPEIGNIILDGGIDMNILPLDIYIYNLWCM